MKISLVVFLLCIAFPIHSQTLEELMRSTDSAFQRIDSTFVDTTVIEDDILFNVIKERFNNAKVCYTAQLIADSLYSNQMYKIALLEYERAWFYSENDSLKASLTFNIAQCYSKLFEFEKSNRQIEKLYDDFDILTLFNEHSEMGIIYIENIFRQEEYSRASAIVEGILSDEKYNGNGRERLKELMEFHSIVTGQLKELSLVSNKRAYTVLETYLNTDLKSASTTYNLASFIPGAGYFYNGNYKMGTISALVNIPLAVYLGTRIVNIGNGAKEKNTSKIIVNSLDFLLIYNMVFSRYYKGSRNESVKECKETNAKIKIESIRQLHEAYNLN